MQDMKGRPTLGPADPSRTRLVLLSDPRVAAVPVRDRGFRSDVSAVAHPAARHAWRIWFFVLEACGLAVQLVSTSQAKNLPGRPKTDKLDAMWLARLTEMGLLRAGFVPPKPIRDLRDYTRARAKLTRERSRCWQRLEKLLEGALVKLSSVASKLNTLSAQDMIRAWSARESRSSAFLLRVLARPQRGGQPFKGALH
jgi:transposase